MDMTLAEMDVFLGRYEASGKKKRNRKILIFKYQIGKSRSFWQK
jgi:hypothetical protein